MMLDDLKLVDFAQSFSCGVVLRLRFHLNRDVLFDSICDYVSISHQLNTSHPVHGIEDSSGKHLMDILQ